MTARIEAGPPRGAAAARRLSILGIRGIPASHGGFETFAERLALWLQARGWAISVYCQGSPGGTVIEELWRGIRLIRIPVKRAGALGTIEFDVKATAHARSRPGAILTLGYNTGFLCLWLRALGRDNYVNMDGLEWKRAKYGAGARLFLWVNERLAAWSATRLIADHPANADHLATRTRRHRITMIPYGGDGIIEADAAPLAPLGLAPRRFLTLIARAEPENSILEIVSAFSRRPRGVKLAVLGGYDRAIPYQAAVLAAASGEVVFPGPIYERERLAALRLHGLAYLHGHRVGGTNPSLVEALGAGNPVIAHDNRFNRWVAGDAGLYFADEARCAEAIARLLADADLRATMGAAARARWKARFTWPAVLEEYRALLAGGPAG